MSYLQWRVTRRSGTEKKSTCGSVRDYKKIESTEVIAFN